MKELQFSFPCTQPDMMHLAIGKDFQVLLYDRVNPRIGLEGKHFGVSELSGHLLGNKSHIRTNINKDPFLRKRGTNGPSQKLLVAAGQHFDTIREIAGRVRLKPGKRFNRCDGFPDKDARK